MQKYNGIVCKFEKKRCIFAKKILICSIELKNKVVKALVLVCTLFLCNRLYSQKFFFETDLGLYHILNYSSASIFQDEKETYSAPLVGLNIGVADSSGPLFGIGIQNANIHTSLLNCNEISKQTGFLLSVAYSKDVVQNLSVTMSFLIGVASVRNDFEYFDQNPSAERIAMYIAAGILNRLSQEGEDLSKPASGDGRAFLYAVDVFETETSRARYILE